MAPSSLRARRAPACLSVLVPALLLGAGAEARENTFGDHVLQSGHLGADWRYSPAHGNGLTLTFEERGRIRDEARREMRHHLKDIADDIPLPHITLFSESPDPSPGDPGSESLFSGLGDRFSLARTLGGLEMDIRPFARLKADLNDAEARSGIRLRWGRGLMAPREDDGLRAYVYTDWEVRAGINGVFDGSHGTGGHDLDSGLALSLGAWSLSLEANVAGSGFSAREEDSAAGYLGYAVRF